MAEVSITWPTSFLQIWQHSAVLDALSLSSRIMLLPCTKGEDSGIL